MWINKVLDMRKYKSTFSKLASSSGNIKNTNRQTQNGDAVLRGGIKEQQEKSSLQVEVIKI